MARLINAEKIRRVLGPQHKPHEEVEEAKRLLGRYVLFRPLGTSARLLCHFVQGRD